MRDMVSYLLGRDMPFMSRPLYPVELRSWALLGITIGAVESGVIGVLVKNVFAGQVDNTLLNFAVAIASGASALSNIFSFIWASLSHGRHKVRSLVIVQMCCGVSLLLVATAPINAFGLLMVLTGVVAARVCWSGVTTLRAVIWRANYPRNARARFAGRVLMVTSIIMALTGLAIGVLMDADPRMFRWAYPVAGAVGVWAAYLYRRLRVRGHQAILRAEQGDNGEQSRTAMGFWAILRDDALFRSYMLWNFIFGSGNLMLTAPLILVLSEQLKVSQFLQVFITSSLPLIAIPLATPLWSRKLDAMHVVHYRAINSWVFVVALSCIFLGALRDFLPLLLTGSALLGAGFAGGILGWNLGHNDFAAPEQVAGYMGVNVTLTGLRGLLMPVIGVALYELLEAAAPGTGVWSLLLPVILSTAGAIGFVNMKRRMDLATD